MYRKKEFLRLFVICCCIHRFCETKSTEDDERLMRSKSCVLELGTTRCQQHANSCGPAVGAAILRFLTTSDCPSISRASEDVLIWNMRTQNVRGVTEEEGGTLAVDMAQSLNRYISLAGSDVRYEVQRLQPSIYMDRDAEDYNTNYWRLCRLIYNSLVSGAPCSLLTFFRHEDGAIYGHFVLISGITTTDDGATINYWDPAVNQHREMHYYELNDRLRFGGELVYHYPFPDFDNCLNLINFSGLRGFRKQRSTDSFGNILLRGIAAAVVNVASDARLDVGIQMCVPLKSYQGKMGEQTDNGNWGYRYATSFPYKIKDRHFFYAQSVVDGYHWFIQELLPDGKMGEQTDGGTWTQRYTVGFPYFDANGRHYFYGQSNRDGTNWFIQELLPDGKMGEQTDAGAWNNKYEIAFPYTVGGRTFFWAQNWYNNYWFIQEVLPNGKIGEQTHGGDMNARMEVAFSYSIDGRFYCLLHSHSPKKWYIYQLKPDGKLGEQLDSGSAQKAFSTCAPFYINENRPFFYCQNESGGEWYIQELLSGGRMGDISDSGAWGYIYASGFSYSIGGKHFYYGQNMNGVNWFIQQFN